MLIRNERRRRVGTGLLILIVSGIIGHVLGIFLGVLLPAGALNDVVARSIQFGLEPPLRVDLWILSFSVGFQLSLNGVAFLFMFLGLLFYKKI